LATVSLQKRVSPFDCHSWHMDAVARSLLTDAFDH